MYLSHHTVFLKVTLFQVSTTADFFTYILSSPEIIL